MEGRGRGEGRRGSGDIGEEKESLVGEIGVEKEKGEPGAKEGEWKEDGIGVGEKSRRLTDRWIHGGESAGERGDEVE